MEIQLMENEEQIWKAKAKKSPISNNLVIRLITAIIKFIMFINGFRSKGEIVITNKRIIYSYQNYAWYCINTASNVEYISLNKVATISGGFKASFLCFCKTNALTVTTGGETNDYYFSGVSENEFQEKFNIIGSKFL